MSILNGSISGRIIRKAPSPYGVTLKQQSFFSLTGCSSVALSRNNRWLYAACRGALHIYEIQQNAMPHLVGRLTGIGASRQMALEEGYAYITTRAGGLYIVDVRTPANPRIARHIDTLELATGICVNRSLCLITNRHMGVEIWDVSVPEQPKYLSSFLAGEAQSVAVDSGYAYIGDWVNRQVHIVDIRTPSAPRHVARFGVDGYADGVFVRNGLCLVASGHHSGRLKNRREFEDYDCMPTELFTSGYGQGHGLTLFDVSNPDAPEYLSEIKFPPLYAGGNDTWLVQASGQYAYVTDTYNGVFVVDLKDLLHPVIVAHFLLPPRDEATPLIPPTIQRLHQPASSIACGLGLLYVAGIESGLHILEFDRAMPPAPPAPAAPDKPCTRVRQIFCCSGQVHSLVEKDHCLLLACGNDGLYALDCDTLRTLHHLPINGIVHDIILYRDAVCTAEGEQGIATYTFSRKQGFHLRHRCIIPGDSVRQLVPLERQNRIAAETGVTQVSFLSVDNFYHLTLEKSISSTGMLYHHHLCPTPHPQGFLGAQSLNYGPIWFDCNTLQLTNFNTTELASFCPLEEGIAIQGETIFVIRNRQYGVCSSPEKMPFSFRHDMLSSIPEARLAGQPFALGNTLVLLNRATGYMERLDVQDIHHPRFLDCMYFHGHPEFSIRLNARDYIACGHEGLWILEP